MQQTETAALIRTQSYEWNDLDLNKTIAVYTRIHQSYRDNVGEIYVYVRDDIGECYIIVLCGFNDFEVNIHF